MVLSDRYNADLVEHEFLREEVYLCVPEVLLRQYYTPEEIQGIKERSIQGADLRDFARLPFSLMTNRLGGRIREQFRQVGVEPWAFFTGPSTAQTLPLCASGTAACFSTNLVPGGAAGADGGAGEHFSSYGPGRAHGAAALPAAPPGSGT